MHTESSPPLITWPNASHGKLGGCAPWPNPWQQSAHPIFLLIWVHAFVEEGLEFLRVQTCTRIRERKCRQGMGACECANYAKTDEFHFQVFKAGRWRYGRTERRDGWTGWVACASRRNTAYSQHAWMFPSFAASTSAIGIVWQWKENIVKMFGYMEMFKLSRIGQNKCWYLVCQSPSGEGSINTRARAVKDVFSVINLCQMDTKTQQQRESVNKNVNQIQFPYFTPALLQDENYLSTELLTGSDEWRKALRDVVEHATKLSISQHEIAYRLGWMVQNFTRFRRARNYPWLVTSTKCGWECSRLGVYLYFLSQKKMMEHMIVQYDI